MNDKELFKEVFDRIVRNSNVTLEGTLVYYNGECVFNTDGYNLGYNLYRLTNLLDEVGCFR